MRVVFEDDNQRVQHHSQANALIGASPEERESNLVTLMENDSKRIGLKDDDFALMLTKGNIDESRIIDQLFVMLLKRYHQFVRSKGQVIMGLIVPLIIGVVVCFLVQSLPTDIIGSSPNPYTFTDASYSTPYTTLVAGAGVTETVHLAVSIDSNLTYVGTTYDELFQTIVNATDNVVHYQTLSSEAIAFENVNNFTVIYNASYPLNFVSAVSSLLSSAVSNATNNAVSFTEQCWPLPISNCKFLT